MNSLKTVINYVSIKFLRVQSSLNKKYRLTHNFSIQVRLFLQQGTLGFQQ